VTRDLTVLILLTIVVHAPFIGEAFHLDDAQYLDVALNVSRNPFFPMDLPSVFEGHHQDLWGHTHPPLNAYLIAGLIHLHGGPPSERFLHASFLFFPILLTVSFYFLARRFGVEPLVATALLATNPTLMVSAHTLMADVPFVALWVCATVLFVRGIDESRPSLVYFSSVPAMAACFYAYQGFALLPLLAFYALSRKKFGWREVGVLCAPLALMAAWQLSGYMHRGTTYASTMFGYLGLTGIWLGSTKVRTAIASLTYLGGVILPFPFVFWKIGHRSKGALTWTALAVAGAVAFLRFGDYSLAEKIFFIACFAAGLIAAAWIAGRAIESWLLQGWASDDFFLGLWFTGMLAACVAAFFSGSARYLLPAFPALLLMVMRFVKRAPVFYAGLLAIQLVLGAGLAQADYEFAGLARREAGDFQSKYIAKPQPFIFTAEWGWRYYLRSIGGEIMADDTIGRPGELLVKSRLALGGIFDNQLGRSLKPVEQLTYRVRSPLRLLDPNSHAGFWSDGWGILPFWFSTMPLDEVSIYRVRDD
jgi:4-amino-4-deoxy-L-arabinose transferase-like glycosyltransferase